MGQGNKKIQKILFDCERMKYPHTGLYHFCLQLGHALMRNMNKAEEDISFYMPAAAGKVFGDAAKYIPQNSLHKFLFPSISSFDIWHSTYQGSNYIPSDTHIKEVLTIHDLNFLYEHSERSEKIKRSLKKIQKQIDHADSICTISEYVKSDVQKNLNLRGKPIEVVYNGCNLLQIENLQPPQLLPSQPFLFTIGTVISKKNFHVLPSLLYGNDLVLVISGIILQEEYKDKIKEEAVKYNVQDRVVFTGPVSDNDKEWYLKNCEAFVFPSIAEGFGLPVIEAMSFGKPVFLSTATSLPEIGGDLAYYFQSFDADDMLQTFHNGMNHYKEKKPAAAIRERAAAFSWDNSAKQYIGIYKRLLQTI